MNSKMQNKQIKKINGQSDDQKRKCIRSEFGNSWLFVDPGLLGGFPSKDFLLSKPESNFLLCSFN
jgi:hypothetical protein